MFSLTLAFRDDDNGSIYEMLYEVHSRVVYAIARKILNDEHLAKDATQECFLRVFRNIDKVEDVQSKHTRAYIAYTARSAAIDMYREEKAKNAKLESMDGEEDPTENLESPMKVDEILAVAETSERVRHYIEELSDRDKEIIYLKFFGELEDQEIADYLGITHANERVRLYRAKKNLADMIRSGEGEYANDLVR